MFQHPACVPNSIGIKAKLQIKKEWMKKDNAKSPEQEKEFKEMISSFILEAKTIMLKDKVYIVFAQEDSKQKTLEQVLQIVQCKYRTTVPEQVTMSLFRSSDPIETTTVDICNKDKAQSLTIGFILLLLFIGKTIYHYHSTWEKIK